MKQTWFLGTKSRGHAARCSGCLTPRMACFGNLHLYVKGLSWDEKKSCVFQQNLMFCLKQDCGTKITSLCNNIRPMNIDYVVKKSPDLGILILQEKVNIQAEDAIIFCYYFLLILR